MPLLNLRLTNTDGTNKCVVELPHQIRTQEVKVKSTRVHFNHEDHSTTVGNYHNKLPDSSANPSVTYNNHNSTQIEIPTADPLAEFFLPSNLNTGDMVEYSLAPTAQPGNLPLVNPGYYFVELHKDNANGNTVNTIKFALHSSRNRAENVAAAQRISIDGLAGKSHDHHQFRLVQRMAATDQQRTKSPLKTVYATMPFFTGFEVTSNIAGGGQVPCPIDVTQPVTESHSHVLLLAETIPQGFTVELFEDDGTTPLNLSPDEFNRVSEVNLVLEYSTNNLYS